jgi:acyl-CoA reductase-like NAD-dependent aldehyde dehydrogenase
LKQLTPANEETLAEVAYASDDDVIKAVNAAKLAYDKYWSKTQLLKKNPNTFFALQELFRRRQENLP